MFTGLDGKMSTETVYYVMTLLRRPDYSTEDNIFTGSDGTLSARATYFVETPSRASKVYNPWTGSFIFPFST
ncbi:hypothetical protein ACU8KH_00029 [Lachancea thermotolerans]